MKYVLQRIVQLISLALFVLVTISGKMPLWMAIFVLGVIATLLIGRIYCGWICPINTLMQGVSWIKKKLKIKSLPIPKFMKRSWVRYTMLGVFLLLFVFTMVSGKRLPVLPALLGIGVLITLVFPEALWHRYLCPYGTILSLPGRASKRTMGIDHSRCTNCGLCAKACPADAITKEQGQYNISRKDCLVCMDCQRACPTQAIAYGGKSPKPQQQAQSL